MNRKHFDTKKLTTLALLTAISLVIFMIEANIPTLVPIPGIKLGLANIITLVILVLYTPRDAFMVLICRIVLSSIFAGQMMTLFYSLGGGICCLVVMSFLNTLYQRRYIYITSIFGAIAHNMGQIFVAWILVATVGVVVYIPYLIISGMITGLFTGLCAHFTIKQLRKIKLD